MNSVWILVIIGVWFFLAYRFYGRFLSRRLKINDKQKTPAFSQRDNIDYSPSNRSFLLGHHFASIAGAGPIIGPILAIGYFGWLPVLLWIALGVVFIGAMHDYVSLIASVRNKAHGIAAIAKKSLSPRAGILFGLLILLTLILIITVFSVSTAESIVEKPDLVLPLVTVTLLSLMIGYGVEKKKWNYKISSVVALLLIFTSVWVGVRYPFDFSSFDPVFLRGIFVTLILIYAGIASIVPVWILLRPRDYLSALQMGLILILGLVSVFLVRPVIHAPAYLEGVFPLWPILFITVACGAVSGFHGLVASGTTSKQLSKESHGSSVGYGAMLMEALLAVFVTIVVIAGLEWGSGPGSYSVALSKGWIVLFSSGFGNIVSSVGIPFLGFSVASLLGAFMVNQFILTSVDTSARLSRFLMTESLVPRFKNKILVTLVVLIPSWFLAITHSYESLWRLFGSSNQMIAAITLIAVASYFLSKRLNVKFILLPALFVLVTTLSALLYLAFRNGGYLSEGKWSLVVLSFVLFFLGLFVAYEGFKKLKKKIVKR